MITEPIISRRGKTAKRQASPSDLMSLQAMSNHAPKAPRSREEREKPPPDRCAIRAVDRTAAFVASEFCERLGGDFRGFPAETREKLRRGNLRGPAGHKAWGLRVCRAFQPSTTSPPAQTQPPTRGSASRRAAAPRPGRLPRRQRRQGRRGRKHGTRGCR